MNNDCGGLPEAWHTHLIAWRKHLDEWRTHLDEWRKQVDGTAPDNQIIDSAGDVKMARRIVHSALMKSGLGSSYTGFSCTASLTLKVLKSAARRASPSRSSRALTPTVA